jgi:hypothetical protein
VKFIPSFVVPDCVNYFFTSNHPDAFFLEDTDRRFFIHEVVGKPAEQSRYDAYDKWIYGSAGAPALFDYLLRLSLKDFNPKAAAFSTASKQAMIVDNKSDLGMWAMLLRDDPDHALRSLGTKASMEANLFTPEQLLHAYDPAGTTKVTTNGLGRELKRVGFRQVCAGKALATSVGSARLYAVRSAEKWAAAGKPECVAHWEKHFGPSGKKF